MRQLTAVTLVALLPAVFMLGRTTRAQIPEREVVEPVDILAPLDAKQRAKARFELSLAKEQDLAKAKLKAAQLAWQSQLQRFVAGRAVTDFVIDSGKRLLEAELELAKTPAAVLAAHEKYWASLYELEQMSKARFDAGRIDIGDYAETKYYRLDAELKLVRLQAKMQQK